MARTFLRNKRDGTPVHTFSLGHAPGLTATVLDMGGTITSIAVPLRRGTVRNVVLGLKDLEAYEANGWWNCVIGRYANRLKNGFMLDGQRYNLAKGSNGVTLHSGRAAPWGTRIWEVLESTDTTLTLRLVSPDGDQGFPGRVTVDVSYAVTNGQLIRAKSRQARSLV